MNFVRSKSRKLNRLPQNDYSSAGCYFVTLCTKGKECHFGSIHKGDLDLSALGNFARNSFINIPNFYTNVFVNEFVVMPNHVHGIIVIEDVLHNVVTEQCSVTTNNRCGMLLSQNYQIV